MHRKIIFLGKFDSGRYGSTAATSGAGNAVQQEIIKNIRNTTNEGDLITLVQEPSPAWPRGNLIVNSIDSDDVRFLGYINIPIIKNLTYVFMIFKFILYYRATVIIEYNSYLFENIAILICSKILKSKNCILLQDIRSGTQFKLSQRIHDRLANLLVGKFDLVVPITKQIATRLRLRNYFVFSGGITATGRDLLKRTAVTSKIAVFTGALERYNGLDQLLKLWMSPDIKCELHIFGTGHLENDVRVASYDNSKIIYHGFRDQLEVVEWQAKARFNFCLRYAEGIDDTNFFPSKFFNLACAPGLLVVNRFRNLPKFMENNLGVVTRLQDFLALQDLDDYALVEMCNLRRQGIFNEAQWSSAVSKIIKEMEDV